jgi:hypothetical protein
MLSRDMCEVEHAKKMGTQTKLISTYMMKPSQTPLNKAPGKGGKRKEGTKREDPSLS